MVFLLFAAWLLAQLTWRLVMPVGPPTLMPLSATPVTSIEVAQLDLSRIQGLHLFGKKGAEVSRPSTNEAPETTLNIRLVGVTASNNPHLSAAIIQQGSEQSTYIPGDTISSSRAVVKEIRSDRVLLEHNNRLETLWLEGRDGSEVALVLQTQPVQAAPAAAPEEVNLTTRQLEILEVISISPQQGENGLVGYRLAPKANEAMFREFGLRPGDLAVAINGYDLTNMAEALELMTQLEGLTQAQVRILRDGEYVDIEIYIPAE
nr:type II secretion system protein GspC [Aliidiomarina quisquiliarum]